jgi:hypothetical protein
MAKTNLTTKAVQAAMLATPPIEKYKPDLRTPIGLLRDAVAMQCERAKEMLEQAMQPLRRVA